MHYEDVMRLKREMKESCDAIYEDRMTIPNNFLDHLDFYDIPTQYQTRMEEQKEFEKRFPPKNWGKALSY